MIFGCPASTPPSTAVIADFSTSDGGVPVAPMATAFTYGGPVLTATVASGAWHIVVNAPQMVQAQYIGVGLTLEGNERTSCVDAGAYTGIRFTMAGSVTGSCIFIYGITDSRHENTDFDPRGVGDATVYGPQSALPSPTATPVTISIPFSGVNAPAGGNPAISIDKTKLTRVQWQFAVPGGPSTACAADMTIDDVQFYRADRGFTPLRGRDRGRIQSGSPPSPKSRSPVREEAAMPPSRPAFCPACSGPSSASGSSCSP